MQNNEPQSDTSPPEASAQTRIRRILLAARLVWPLTLMLIGLSLSLVSAALVLAGSHADWIARLLLLGSTVGLIGLAVFVVRFQQQLLKPLAALEESVAQVCHGEPGATVYSTDDGVLGEIARDIGSLNEELTDLYEDMDSRVARQTARLAQKTASLKILYDVAATINEARDLDDLLLRFLRVLKEMVNARAATIRLRLPGGGMRLVGSVGEDNHILSEQETLPIRLCVCGKALSSGDVLCEHDPERCSVINGRRMYGPDQIDLVSVPLAYHEQELGVYNLYVPKPGIADREDILELLQTIGAHLGMAVAKQHSDAEARRLSIIEERTMLAHELHDSLAQTLASLRFQVRMLEDVFKQESIGQHALADLLRIKNGIDEAHTELRELLNNFRAPLDQRGLVPALRQLTERFGQEVGVHAFFQCDCRAPSLSAAEEMQILRIVQESLANIRKHAQALTVRVLLRCQPGQYYTVLIEDDGVGFEMFTPSGKPGEHIGLSIMEERARRLGGVLRIESEPGEGTRVEISYRPSAGVPGCDKKGVAV